MTSIQPLCIPANLLDQMIGHLSLLRSVSNVQYKHYQSEIERIQKQRDAEIAALKQKQEKLEEELKDKRKTELESQIACFMAEHNLCVSTPIPIIDLVQYGTDINLDMNNVAYPDNEIKVTVFVLPSVHYCNDCKKITKHVCVGCNFPLSYYLSTKSLDKPFQVNEENLTCLECMFECGMNCVHDLEI